MGTAPVDVVPHLCALAQRPRGIGGVKPVGQAQEHLFEVAPFKDQLIEHNLVLSGQRSEPLGGGPVDDQRVRCDLPEGHRHGLEDGGQAGKLGRPYPQSGIGAGPATEFSQSGLQHQPPVGDDDHVVDGLLHL